LMFMHGEDCAAIEITTHTASSRAQTR